MKRKFFIALLFLFNAFAGNAQWTYTTTVQQTGPCIPFPKMAPIPFYTKSACEASRQSELNQSGSDWSIYADGKCTTIITCTPCVGSDIGTSGQGSTPGQSSLPGQTNPGDVSLQGPLNGNPFFTPHQSQAFEEWASEYKQLLASYGITSILGKNFTIPRTPLTDDKYFNAAYTNLVINYTPKTAPVSTPKKKPVETPKTEPVNPSNTEFSGKTVPLMGSAPLTQAERERQILVNKFGQQYIDGMTYIRPESGIVESTIPTTDLSDSKEYKIAEAFFDKIGDTKLGVLPAYTGKLMLSTVNETDKLIRDITINGKYSAEELTAMNPVKVIVNNVVSERVSSLTVEALQNVIEKLGVGFIVTKYGEARKAGVEFAIKLGKDSSTLMEKWTAKRH